MKNIAEMNEAELSTYVQSHLKKAGIDVVLSGGSAVTIYSENKWVCFICLKPFWFHPFGYRRYKRR